MSKYTQPVKVGDELKVQIENIGEKGDGISRHENFVIIIPNGEIDEYYKIRIQKVFKNWALGDIIEVNENGI